MMQETINITAIGNKAGRPLTPADSERIMDAVRQWAKNYKMGSSSIKARTSLQNILAELTGL